MRYSQQVDEQHRESRVSVDSPCYVSGLCLYVHMNALTHSVGCICCCLGGMEQQGDLRKGEQLCFGSDVPFGCGSSH